MSDPSGNCAETSSFINISQVWLKVPCEQIMSFSWSMINIFFKFDSTRNKIGKIINLFERLKHLKNQWVIG
jgi:hypothetical protein